ncbi:flagellar basal body P-ring formation protein FlgA [Burkholderiaceae bacterium DAT-1]|nr:flagellar basal body P-ring formation protein FlgA [Burkholderiaceae bacterium DAT-1]
MLMNKFRQIALLVALLPIEHAIAQQDVAAMHVVVRSAYDFLSAKLADHGERASFEMGTPASLDKLAPCKRLTASLPPGNRLVGQTWIRVRCEDAARWTVMVPATIRLTVSYWVTTKVLPPNHTIDATDIREESGDAAALPSSVVSKPEDAIGRVTLAGEMAGVPLNADHLRAPWLVKANETVKILNVSAGFEITSEGRSLGNASKGQSVTVRTQSGSTITGIVSGEREVRVGN